MSTSACVTITWYFPREHDCKTLSLSKMAAKMADNGKLEHERAVEHANDILTAKVGFSSMQTSFTLVSG
jgi:hypothetical protein